jgi:two-component system, cell cycle sensor histidine kinase and response regulator CckA
MAHVTIERDLASDLPPLHGEPVQVVQVILNLVLNAADALPKGGTIRISTGRMEVSQEESDVLGGSGAGNYVYVEVEDNGTGMPPEVAQRIYDPFFTTKPPGKGTGLGLAMTQRTVNSHGGVIVLDTQPGRGTRFRIGFPVSQAPLRARPTGPRKAPSHATILVVDGEAPRRELARAAWETGGHRVLFAEDEPGAIEAVRKEDAAIDLVFLNCSQVNGSGGPTFEALRQVAPNMPILIGADGSARSKDEYAGAAGFVHLPTDSAEILLAVHRTLAGENP